MIRLAVWRDALVRWRGWVVCHLGAALVGLNVIALMAAAWVLTRPGALFGPLDGTWHRIQVNGVTYVGVDPNYPPFAEWTPEQIAGLEPDIAREIGRRFGVETQILIMGYDGLYDALYTGEVDFLISGLHVDPIHDEWVHYTQPYFDAGQILVSRADRAFQEMSQLDGKTVAVEMASAGDMEAQRWQRRLHALDILRYVLPDEAMHAVQMGDVDAALVDTVSARLYLAQHSDLVMACRTTRADGYVIAIRKANFRLIKETERALDTMIADGTLEAIIDRWLQAPGDEQTNRSEYAHPEC